MGKGRNHKINKTFCTKASVDIWKSRRMQYRRDEVGLRTNCIKMSNLRSPKRRVVSEQAGYFYYSKNSN